jgi:hypothetical protein
MMLITPLSTSFAMPMNAQRARSAALGGNGLRVKRGARASRGPMGPDEGWEGEGKCMAGPHEGEVGGELFAVVAPHLDRLFIEPLFPSRAVDFSDRWSSTIFPMGVSISGK